MMLPISDMFCFPRIAGSACHRQGHFFYLVIWRREARHSWKSKYNISSILETWVATKNASTSPFVPQGVSVYLAIFLLGKEL